MQFLRALVVVITTLLVLGVVGCKSAGESKAVKSSKNVNNALPQANSTAGTVTGEVVEILNSGGYSYLQLKNSQGVVWVAIPQARIEKGQLVAVQKGAVMKTFVSRGLNRTFKNIVFSGGLAVQQVATQTQGGDNANEIITPATIDPTALTISGKVLKTMNSGSYSYLLLATSKGTVWVAIPQTSLAVSQVITVRNGAVMKNFESKTLHRTFKNIIFSGGLVIQQAAQQTQSDDKTNATSTSTQTSPTASTIAGKVLETMNSGGYTYFQLQSPQGAVWVAIPESELLKGQQVAVRKGAVLKSFESKTLHRTFKDIIFSNGLAGQPAATQAQSSDKISESPVPNNKIEKAKGDNAYTIAEIHENLNNMNNKKVRIRGRVVKAAMMIMGKNWLHLQDGSGNAAQKNRELVVTTLNTAERDTIITVEGTLVTNKDFGAGYRYEAIIENAKIK